MSNKIVPSTYRAIIDDVITNIRHEFDEFGVSEDVLEELQHKWETKVINSHVAEFDPPAAAAVASTSASTTTPVPPVTMPSGPNPFAPPGNGTMSQSYYPNPYMAQLQAQQVQVKAEPRDPSYILQATQFTLPPLPGPSIASTSNATPGLRTAGTSVLSFPMPHSASVQPTISDSSTARIPQVDGPPSSAFSDETPSLVGLPPRNMHPSLPQASMSAPPVRTDPDPEAINSDLDDSDTENEVDDVTGDGGAEEDIVYCTYDKVARVKNKWKTTLTHGMVHVNGKDYLFNKCTGEFEW